VEYLSKKEKGKLKRFWLHELTRPAFEEWLDNEPAPVVILGIGSVEQHGPHLPLGMDSLAVRATIEDVAKRTNSVCFHPCWPGYSPHHMGFTGTVTLTESTLMGVLMDTIDSLAAHGVKRFLLVNAHGGNSNIMALVMQLSKRYSSVMIAAPSGPSGTELAKKISQRQARYNDVHSGPTETAIALLHFPELVEMKRLEGWKPTLELDEELKAFLNPDRPDYEIARQVYAACSQPDTDDFTSSGIYGLNDPREADVEEARKRHEERVQFLVDFINLWKKTPVPPAFKEE
jgi:creatinine amidohydrolase